MNLITRLVLLAALAGLLQPYSARAAVRGVSATAPGAWGAGVVLGDPSGLTAKHRLGGDDAVDFGLAYTFKDYLLLYSDYLRHFPGVLGDGSQFATELAPYVGLGGVVTFGSSVGVGVRVPLGLEWTPARAPLGVFVELAPGLALAPGTAGFLQGGVGVRYFFR